MKTQFVSLFRSVAFLKQMTCAPAIISANSVLITDQIKVSLLNQNGYGRIVSNVWSLISLRSFLNIFILYQSLLVPTTIRRRGLLSAEKARSFYPKRLSRTYFIRPQRPLFAKE